MKTLKVYQMILQRLRTKLAGYQKSKKNRLNDFRTVVVYRLLKILLFLKIILP